MKSKTIQLINLHYKLLKEQGEAPDDVMDSPDASVQDTVEPEGENETMPMSSQGEDSYIKNLIDAAIFQPSAEEATTLLNLQSVMDMKRYENAREEILPMVLSIISKETQNNELRSDLDSVE